MILTLAVLAGLLAGAIRAWLNGRQYDPASPRAAWLVLIAFLPQLAATRLELTRHLISDNVAAAILVVTGAILLLFGWLNRRQSGGWILLAGLLLNELVIVANGGLMPIAPDTVARVYPNAPSDSWEVGRRLWFGKDVVLPIEETTLRWLSDRFLFPEWLPIQVAFSLGDVLIAVGVFGWLWSGVKGHNDHEVSHQRREHNILHQPGIGKGE